MKPVILFRRNFNSDTEGEYVIASKYLDCVESRVDLKNRLVVGRYSVLPFYSELSRDLSVQESNLINNVTQHEFIADFLWYDVVKSYTPKTWFDLQSLPKDGGPYIVKGKTNSRKFEWNKKMFAANYREAVDISSELMQDGLIGPQGLVYRQYVQLQQLEVGLNGLPFSNEWRFFFLKEKELAHGFYWTCSESQGSLTQEGIDLAHEVARQISLWTNFFVVDVAQLINGKWMLIEINDGQMSGLSGCNPDELYSNLSKRLSLWWA